MTRGRRSERSQARRAARADGAPAAAQRGTAGSRGAIGNRATGRTVAGAGQRLPGGTAPAGSPRADATIAGGATPESGIRAIVWTTIPAALATELGALAMIGFGPVAGVVTGYVAVLVLQGRLAGLSPAPSVVRGAMLVGGPPLRYALIVVATWYEWAIRGSGPGPALVAAVLLAIVLPMIATALANARGGPARTR